MTFHHEDHEEHEGACIAELFVGFVLFVVRNRYIAGSLIVGYAKVD